MFSYLFLSILVIGYKLIQGFVRNISSGKTANSKTTEKLRLFSFSEKYVLLFYKYLNSESCKISKIERIGKAVNG